ncbi:beta strand repeat-containing protein, partial [Flagellimonas okinawensis]
TSNITANTNNIATNTSDISDNASDIATNTAAITTNATAISANATDIADHIAADADTNIGNEYNTGSGITGGNLEITDGGGTESVNLISTDANNNITAGSDGALYLNVASVSIAETNTTLSFDGSTNALTYTNELGNNPGVDLSSLDDSAGVAANASAITTNATNISDNASDIATNTAAISTNASNITSNTSNITANTNNIATNASDISDNVTDISTNTGNITTNATNISDNASDIATNTAAITTNATAISANATDISDHIAADGDLSSTNEIQNIEQVLTESNDANGLVITGLGTPTAGSDAATKAYVDSMADDDITGASLDAPSNVLTISEGTADVTVDLSDLDDSAGVAANASAITTNASNITSNTSNITANTNNIATNASDISDNASDIATNTAAITTNATAISANATDIADHIAADADTNIGNEYNTGSGITGGNLEITDGGGTESVNLISSDANNNITAGSDGALYLNVASVSIAETNTTLSFDGSTNALTYTNELGNNPGVDLSSLDDSAGVAANASAITTNATNISDNASDIETNTAAITTNATAISANATDIADHIAADGDLSSTNEIQNIEQVLTESNDANGLVITGLGTPTAGSDAATKAYVDSMADDDITGASLDAPSNVLTIS